MFAKGVSYMAFIMLRYVPSTGFSRGSVIKNPPVVQEIRVPSLGREDPLEREMTTHSSGLSLENSMDRRDWCAPVHSVQRVRHD